VNRLESTLRSVRDRGGKALVPFLTAGFPDRQTFVDLLLEAEQAGADALEVGVPFSDPSADGPVIQEASARVLGAGYRLEHAFADLRAARERGLGIPALFMTYYNPVLARGPGRFAREAREAGADGVLVVDLPWEEGGEFLPLARDQGLDTVLLVAPTTPEDRVGRIVAGASGFVYCVSVTGVTGQKRPMEATVGDLVGRVRRHTDLPALVGFGVSDAASALALAARSDGVIVGSALIRTLGDLAGASAVARARRFLGSLREALSRD